MRPAGRMFDIPVLNDMETFL